MSAESALDAGAPYAWVQWKQVDESSNAVPSQGGLTVS